MYVTLACADLLDQVETSDCAMHIHYTVSNAMDYYFTRRCFSSHWDDLRMDRRHLSPSTDGEEEDVETVLEEGLSLWCHSDRNRSIS